MNTHIKFKYWLSASASLLVSLISAQEVEKSIYITGNTWGVSNTKVLSQIAKDAKTVENPTLLILGNATPKTEFKNSLDQQLRIIEGFGKDA